MRALAFAALTALAGCSHTLDGPAPSLTAVTPQAACNAQVAQVVMVSGAQLSPLNDHTLLDTDRLELPQLTLLRTCDLDGGDVDPTGSNVVAVPNDPDRPELSDETWASETSMSFGICPPGTCGAMMSPPLRSDWRVDVYPDKQLPTGLYSLEVKNRAQAKDFILPDAIVIVPPPDLERVDADLACTDTDNTVTLSGDFFLVVNGVKPEVLLFDDLGFSSKLAPANLTLPDEGCRSLPSPTGLSLRACRTIRATIPAGFVTFVHPGVDTFRNLKLQVGAPAPVACRSTKDVEITFVPEPRLDRIAADLICDAQDDQPVTFSGAFFLTVDGTVPTVTFDPVGVVPVGAATSCTPVGRSGFPREVVASCQTLSLTIAEDMLPPTAAGAAPSNYAFLVTNPPPADCSSAPPVDLTVASPPELDAVVPDLVCNAQDGSTFTLTGRGFLGIDALAPSVAFTDGMGNRVTAKATLDGASCTPAPGPTEMLQVCTRMQVVVPEGTLALGPSAVSVTNPPTAGCTSSELRLVWVVPPPVLLSAMPAELCTAQGEVPLVLGGLHFLTIDGSSPTVTFTDPEGVRFTIGGAAASGCTPLAGPMEMAEDCTTLTILVPRNALALQAYTLTVANPAPAGCTSDVEDQPPVVVVGTPPPTLSMVSPTLLCSGGGALQLAGTNFEPGARVSIGPLTTTSVTVASATSATANFGAGLQPGGPYDVTLSNPDGCSASLAQQVMVQAGLIAFFADPPTVWNGIATQITVYGANVVGGIQSVGIAPTGTSSVIPLALVNARGSRATAVVPVGTPAGTYDVLVQDAQGPAALDGGLRVEQTTSFTITRVAPAYGSTLEAASVTINSNGAFVATPRAYLSAGASAATALSAVSFVDARTLTAVVPAGSPPGVYDLIVVNPDGTVGVLRQAFTEIADAVPMIASLNPGEIASGQTFQVVGQNFASIITFACFDTAGASVGAATGFAQSPPSACGAAQCVTISGGTFPGSYCIATVTNPADGASFDYSALSINTPSLKLGVFAAAHAMTTPRRALGIATARATPSARYLYAIGGDGGM
jgi:hypothetical protein